MITKCGRACYVGRSEVVCRPHCRVNKCHVTDSGVQDVDPGHARGVAYRIHGDGRVHINGD